VRESKSKYLLTIVAFQYAYTLVWSRQDGRRLSASATDDGQGTLTISPIREEDVGTYVCIGSNYYMLATDEAQLTVSGKCY